MADNLDAALAWADIRPRLGDAVSPQLLLCLDTLAAAVRALRESNAEWMRQWDGMVRRTERAELALAEIDKVREQHLCEIVNLQADLAAERVENAHLREAFVTMERAYNEGQADLAALKARTCAWTTDEDGTPHAGCSGDSGWPGTFCPCCGAKAVWAAKEGA